MHLSITHLSKTYGDAVVLNDVSFTLDAGQKLGLVGDNGAGKSTLLKVVAGEIKPDSGEVQVARGVELGYLPQMLSSATNQTVAQLIDGSLGGLRALEERLHTLERAMAQPKADLDSIFAEYSTLNQRFEQRGGYDLDHRLDAVMGGLGVDHLARERRVVSLSGGEKSRVGLAALLLRAPDLLLLDEPTNHLDFGALDWLESYLRDFRGALLVVSHDRQFLNATVERIVEIDEHTHAGTLYSGSYDFYAELKAQQRARWTEDFWAQQEEIRELRRAIKTSARQVAHNRAQRDGDKFLKAFKAGRVEGTVARNVHAAEEKLRRLEADPAPPPQRPLVINPNFDPAQLSSKTPLATSHVSKSFGDQLILCDISFSLQADSRVVIVGPNGAGKSTLLRILAGLAAPDAGEVSVSPSAVVGFLDQEQQTLTQAGTLFEAYRGERVGDWETLKAELLRYGFFTYEELQKPVAALSIGQKRKLQIAQLIARGANLLLLDEPTNHISLDVLEEFEQALLDFPGAILAVSHDRRFIERFAGEVWTLSGGELR